MPEKPQSFYLTLLAVSMLGACGHTEAEARAVAERPLTVRTAKVHTAEVQRGHVVAGSLVAGTHTRLAANATGSIVSATFERGDRVARGDVLFRIDARAARLRAEESAAEEARTRMLGERRRADCARADEVFGRHAMSRTEYERIHAECDVAEIDRDAARARVGLAALALRDGVIRAPFDAVVSERLVNVGEHVTPDTAVVVLVSEEGLRLEIPVPERDFAEMRVGTALRFRVQAYPEEEFVADVRRLGGTVRERTRDVLVEAEVRDTPRVLLPGMFATVVVPERRERLPIVPAGAIVMRDGASHVFVVVRHRIEERVVALGPDAGDARSVLTGLTEGERVVLDPGPSIRNGRAAN